MIFNLGSINVDYFYEVPHLPQPGETLAAKSYATGLGERARTFRWPSPGPEDKCAISELSGPRGPG